MTPEIDVSREFFAHSLEGIADTQQWERLEDHLNDVANLAEQFAGKIQAGPWGRLTGLWHDLGKYSEAFQNYLLTANGLEAHIEQRSKVDHSTAGARHANGIIPVWGRLLAFVIAGHHVGLADAFGSSSSLEMRLDEQHRAIEPIPAAPLRLLAPGVSIDRPPLDLDTEDQHVTGFQLSFFTRMLFSCLVDADFLATERFMSPQRAANRPTQVPVLAEMQSALQQYMADKIRSAGAGLVNSRRQQVLTACRQAASRGQKLFSLTVPTGGGKTLSSLAFAIGHALQFGKQRIVYAIPFTSIIEQTAGVFREVFAALGEDIVLEHHCNIDPDKETHRSRLAAENWDAPVVVTTNVQFFESLFASKTSRCRKLHNLVDSVLILDEAQTLPVDLLRPCLSVLNELTRNYGCTVVLCTATQPAIQYREEFSIGLHDVHEIIPNPAQLYLDMKRVDTQQLGRLSDEELVDRLIEHDSFLLIVNTRGHAAKLYRDVVEGRDARDGSYHLSTLMCGEHRAQVIAEIRARLHQCKPCRVISTQLIEAGVDVDFPVVFRAMSGIDSIAQAAGRCNREGRLKSGTVYTFDPTDAKLFGYLKDVAKTAGQVAPDFDDLLDPAAIEKYFALHYWNQEGENRWDRSKDRGVMRCFPFDNDLPFLFRTAAERFRMIEEVGQAVFVPYGAAGQSLIDKLRQHGPNRYLLRRLQRFTVTLNERLYRLMESDIERIDEYSALANPSSYDERLGVRIDQPGYIEPSAMIV